MRAKRLTCLTALLVAGACTRQTRDDVARDDAGSARDTSGARHASTAAVSDTLQRRARLTGPVTLSRHGGVAGYDDQVIIQPDGRVVRVRGAAARSQLAADLVAHLAAVLTAETGSAYQPEIGADRMYYVVEYGGRRWQVDAQAADRRAVLLRDVVQRVFAR